VTQDFFPSYEICVLRHYYIKLKFMVDLNQMSCHQPNSRAMAAKFVALVARPQYLHQVALCLLAGHLGANQSPVVDGQQIHLI
jgi:hypothetical protein